MRSHYLSTAALVNYASRGTVLVKIARESVCCNSPTASRVCVLGVAGLPCAEVSGVPIAPQDLRRRTADDEVRVRVLIDGTIRTAFFAGSDCACV